MFYSDYLTAFFSVIFHYESTIEQLKLNCSLTRSKRNPLYTADVILVTDNVQNYCLVLFSSIINFSFAKHNFLLQNFMTKMCHIY